MKLDPPHPELPQHLSARMKKWFAHVVGTRELKQHHVLLLIGCCEALDRAGEARRAVKRDGAYIKMASGEIRKHPGLAVERDALIVFSRLLRELDLDLAPPKEAKRGPLLRSLRGAG